MPMGGKMVTMDIGLLMNEILLKKQFLSSIWGNMEVLEVCNLVSIGDNTELVGVYCAGCVCVGMCSVG